MSPHGRSFVLGLVGEHREVHLTAYPVIEWAVEPIGADQSVALSLRTNRQVKTAFLFAHEETSALHAALTQALDDATEPAPSRRPHRIGVAL